MLYVRNDGPEPAEVRYGPRRTILRPGEEIRVFAKQVELTPIRTEELQDHLHHGPVRETVSAPCRLSNGD
jgi:hypothetical protein